MKGKTDSFCFPYYVSYFLVAVLGLVGNTAQARISTESKVGLDNLLRQESIQITGQLVDNQQNPLEGLTLFISGTSFRTLSSHEGRFKLPAKTGGNELVVSYLGKIVFKKQLDITNGPVKDLGIMEITLQTDELEEVSVTAAWHNKFSKKNSDNIAKMPLKDLENPQTYTVIPRELMEEQVVTDFNAALKNAPGIAIGPRVDNGRNVFLLRGFEESSYMRNGIASPAYMDIEPANLESIEVIKGPSGTLYGSSLISFGGLINRVTKKPVNRFMGSGSLVMGGYNLYRLTADVNAPLTKDSTLLFRLNTALNRQGTFQDYGYSHTFMVAPVISYQVDPKLKITLEAEIYNRDATALPGFTISGDKTGITNANQLNSVYKRSFSSDQLNMTGGSNGYFGQIDYQLSSTWQSKTNIAYTVNNYYRIGVRPYVLNDSLIRRTGGDVDYNTEALDIQQNFTGELKTGIIRHRLLFGLDYLQRNNYLYNNLTKGTVDTVNYQQGATPFVGRQQILDLAARTAKNPSNSANNTYAAYASDVLDINSRLFLSLSLRYDYYDNKDSQYPATGEAKGGYHQGAWSPKFGLVYQLIKDKVSLFANHLNGFSNTSGQDANGLSFKPQHANQWEGGVKSALWDGRLNAMVSYYDIQVTNVLRQDLNNPGFSIQDGVRNSKGVEAEVIVNPFSGFNLIAGYGYNKSVYEEADADIAGNRPANIPNHMANFWMSYALQQGPAKGLGVGFGGNYIGENFYNDSNSIIVPSSFVLNSSVFYAKTKYRFAVKLDNITNRYYWASLNPQMPFRLSANLQIMF